MPIRWRLAGGSALLTLIILCGFAGIVGGLTSKRIYQDFDEQVRNAADVLGQRLQYEVQEPNLHTGRYELTGLRPALDTFSPGNGSIINVVGVNGYVFNSSQPLKPSTLNSPPGASDDTISRFGLPRSITEERDGYRIETRVLQQTAADLPAQQLYVQYARPLGPVEATVARLRLFLIIGVLGGAGLALLAGLVVARRAMAPITELTATARTIEETRDPTQKIPYVEADDEVAELARTLSGMLQALDASRAETEGALARQREFVADASHELRTPLTSVLANLELLADSLHGEQQEAAHSALRSSRRMRRLVADLLLLARHDAARKAPHQPTDVGQVLVEAAAEVGAIAQDHELSINSTRAVVDGARDELHRLALNLMENAIRHTPPGTHVHAAVERVDGVVRITVEDDGPGIPPELRARVFERFVRGVGDRGGSSGLGLSIVHAVAAAHGGSVSIESPTTNGAGHPHGTRFEVVLPLSGTVEQPAVPAAAAASDR
jgi:signal transduction histidine kinase